MVSVKNETDQRTTIYFVVIIYIYVMSHYFDKIFISIILGQVNIPEPQGLPGIEGDDVCPYMIVGDEGFPLKPYLMRPYAGRTLDCDRKKVFNYRLSRCRRVIENCFGELLCYYNAYIYVNFLLLIL